MDEYAWEYHEIREHFIKSAVESEIDSGYSATALYNAAHEQFTQFIAKLEDDASARGYEDGASDSTHGVKADLFAMEQKIALLMEDLEAKTSIEVKRLMHLLKSLRIHKAPPADDVEEWAYQDGWNDIITKLEDSLRGEQVDATPHS